MRVRVRCVKCGGGRLTKGDSWVLLTNVLALLVGEEHVGRETALWGVGVWREISTDRDGIDLFLGAHTLLLLSFSTGLGCALGGLFLRHDGGLLCVCRGVER